MGEVGAECLNVFFFKTYSKFRKRNFLRLFLGKSTDEKKPTAVFLQ